MKTKIRLKIAKIFLCIGFSNMALGQIGFNSTNNDPSAILTIDSDPLKDLYGVGFPMVELQGITEYMPFVPPLKEGLSVFNTANTSELLPGFYFWNGTKWIMMDKIKENFVIYQKIKVSDLGYTPKDSIGSWRVGQNYNIVVNNNNSTVRLEKCITWIEDEISKKPGYQYCAFTLNSTGGVTWTEAFEFSKSVGGYLLTIPQVSEWDFIKFNLIKTIPLTGNIWIGYNKIRAGGNTTRSKWITGEKWSINWVGSGSTGATVQSNFLNNYNVFEPNNIEGKEGCTHIIRKDGLLPVPGTPLVEYKWNDADCNQRSGFWGDYNQIIVKFGGLKD